MQQAIVSPCLRQHAIAGSSLSPLSTVLPRRDISRIGKRRLRGVRHGSGLPDHVIEIGHD